MLVLVLGGRMLAIVCPAGSRGLVLMVMCGRSRILMQALRVVHKLDVGRHVLPALGDTVFGLGPGLRRVRKPFAQTGCDGIRDELDQLVRRALL